MKSPERVTVYTIAEEAGVSVATVSRALNHPEQIRPETLQKVLTACVRQNFEKRPYHPAAAGTIPTAAAAAIPSGPAGRSSVTTDILLVLPASDNPFFNEIASGANRAAADHDNRLFIEYVILTERNCRPYLDRMNRHPFAGYIFASPLPISVYTLLRRHCRMIQCGEYDERFSETSYVAVDDVRCQRDATAYLLSLGVRQPAYLSMPQTYPSASRHIRGFTDALHNAGCTIPPHWIVPLPEATFDAAYDAAYRLLSEANRPDAILCGSDILALAAIRAAGDLGMKIPEQLKIIGFDDLPLASRSFPALSTIRRPGAALGQTAYEQLYKELTSPQPLPPAQILLPTQLILRQTC